MLATGATDHATRRRVFELCEKAHVNLLVIPDLHELMSGRVKVSQIRHVQVDDLLGRDPVQLDTSGLRHMLAGKAVLVTGGGGSIGAELCRQIARFEPLRIIVFEMNEFALYQITESLHNRFPASKVVPIVGDIKDERRLIEVFVRYEPTVVFHAAAYKHVPDPRAGQRLAGGAQQRPRHAGGGRRGGALRSGEVRLHLHRQGGQSRPT